MVSGQDRVEGDPHLNGPPILTSSGLVAKVLTSWQVLASSDSRVLASYTLPWPCPPKFENDDVSIPPAPMTVLISSFSGPRQAEADGREADLARQQERRRPRWRGGHPGQGHRPGQLAAPGWVLGRQGIHQGGGPPPLRRIQGGREGEAGQVLLLLLQAGHAGQGAQRQGVELRHRQL